MKKQIILLVTALSINVAFSQQRSVKGLSNGWKFSKGKTDEAYQTQFDDKAWQTVTVPQGVQKKNDSSPQSRYRLMWMDVRYEPGTVRVVAYDKNGKPAAENSVVTAGKPHRLLLEPDRVQIDADGRDISFVTVSAVDEKGNLCPTVDEQLSFKVSGNGKFRASCNGDASSLEQFHLPTMKLFNGKLVVLVQSNTNPGDIRLTVEGND